jgi:membrane-bound lytic murein transglycosylase B
VADTIRMMAKSTRILFAAMVSVLASQSASVAQPVSDPFQSFIADLGRQAEAQGVSRRTIDSVLPTLTFSQTVVNLDRKQPGGLPNAPIPKFAPYAATHVDNARISRGRAKYTALRPMLERVERQTGVPESIMMAIYGHETNYGSFTGNFDLANALATLAYEGRRRQLFTTEFIATLKMIDRGYPREVLKGSWAGATGYPQFLPSMYLRLGRDGDGDGKADIWRSEADALASIANYFVAAGWRPNVPWGTRASVPAGFDAASVRNRTVSPRCPRVHDRLSQWKTVGEWRAMGIAPVGSRNLRDRELASFFQPDGPGTPAWLLTGNYRVILDYNCSNFYALSVGLLADAIEQ